MTTTFEVGTVAPANTRLSTVSVADAIRRTIEPPATGAPGDRPSCEAWTEIDGGVHATAMHAFPGAVQVAFDAHLPLILSPDQLWILLAQGAAHHVHLNAEALRSRFVSHEGRETIRVRRDDFVKGSPDNPWPEMVEAFSDALHERLGKRAALFVADFSTTGPLERTVSQVVLMRAVTNYFEFEFQSLCGIPHITLLGTPADWRGLRDRARVFRELALDWWLDALEPLLDAFVDAAEGRVDRAHWRSMYKLNSASGGPYVTGWIQALFPYLADPESRQLVRNRGLDTWREGMGALFGGGPTTNQLPPAMSAAPFEWQVLSERYPMELLAGFIGVRQDGHGSVTPQLGWGVRERPTDR